MPPFHEQSRTGCEQKNFILAYFLLTFSQSNSCNRVPLGPSFAPTPLPPKPVESPARVYVTNVV